MQVAKKRWIFYGVVLVLLGCLAVWTFREPDGLKELKELELVTEGIEDQVALVKQAVKIIDGKDRRKLVPLMVTRDGIEFKRITDSVFGEAMSPVKIQGARRLKNCSRRDNLAIYVRSESRDELYLFHLLKDRKGKYLIRDIELTERKLPKES